MSMTDDDSVPDDRRVRTLPAGDETHVVQTPAPRRRFLTRTTLIGGGMLLVGGILGYLAGSSGATTDDTTQTTIAAPDFLTDDPSTAPELLQTPTTSTLIVGTTDVTPLALRVPPLANHFIAGTFELDGRRQSFVWQPVEAKARFDSIEADAVGSWDATGTYFASLSGGLGPTTGDVWVRGRGPLRLLYSGGTEPQWHPDEPSLAWLGRQIPSDPFRLYVASIGSQGAAVVETYDLARWLPNDEDAWARLVGWGDWGFAIQWTQRPDGDLAVLTLSRNGSARAGAAEMVITALDPIDGAITGDGSTWFQPDLLEDSATTFDGPPVLTRLGGQRASYDGAGGTITVSRPDGSEEVVTLRATPVAISRNGLVLAAVDDAGTLLIVDVLTGEATALDIPGALVSFQIGVVE